MAPAFLRPSPFRQRRLKQPVCREPRQTATRARGPKVLPGQADRGATNLARCACGGPQNAHDSPSHARIGSPAPARAGGGELARLHADAGRGDRRPAGASRHRRVHAGRSAGRAGCRRCVVPRPDRAGAGRWRPRCGGRFLPVARSAHRRGQRRLRRGLAQARAAPADHRLRAEKRAGQHRLPGLAGAAARTQPPHLGTGRR